MPDDSATSISDRFPPRGHRVVPAAIFVVVLLTGIAAAVHFARLDLTLSHYDARAHLVVARRIFDSLTPGWRQIGAVWLPLPHLLSLPVIGWDWTYQTGFPVVAISIVALASGLASLSAFLLRHGASTAAAVVAPLVIVLNPNVLYLMSTPMTEPLLFGLSLIALARVDRWIEHDTPSTRCPAALAIFALALTRYEGWCIAAALVTWSALARWRDGLARATTLAYPLAAAIGGFLVLGWASTGVWFVSGGFYEREPATYGDMVATLRQVWASTLALGSPVIVWAGVAGMVLSGAAVLRRRPALALTAALLAAAALPAVAFYQGHPHRVRYMVPLVVAAGALAGVAVASLPGRVRMLAAVLLVVAGVWQRPPFDPRAPMVIEAQWETPFRLERRRVTAALLQVHDGTPILASMGSLGHYMQETSRSGFALATFLHEGNGDLWQAALEAPARHVRWMLIEERAEGGDLLAARARADAAYLARFTRIAEGGGVALYRRAD